MVKNKTRGLFILRCLTSFLKHLFSSHCQSIVSVGVVWNPSRTSQAFRTVFRCLNHSMDLSKAINQFIIEAGEDPRQIARIADEHRRGRNTDFEQRMLGQDYPGVPIDEILTARLNDPTYLDPRNNLCLFAWPPQEVCDLIMNIQQQLKILAPSTCPLLSHSIWSNVSYTARYLVIASRMAAYDGDRVGSFQISVGAEYQRKPGQASCRQTDRPGCRAPSWARQANAEPGRNCSRFDFPASRERPIHLPAPPSRSGHCLC